MTVEGLCSRVCSGAWVQSRHSMWQSICRMDSRRFICIETILISWRPPVCLIGIVWLSDETDCPRNLLERVLLIQLFIRDRARVFTPLEFKSRAIHLRQTENFWEASKTLIRTETTTSSFFFEDTLETLLL